MLLSEMPQHTLNHGVFVRRDNERFQIDSILFESPAAYPHWLAHFTVKHATWTPLLYKAIIPKSVAATVPLAQALLHGPIADQVRSNQENATPSGRSYVWVHGDGWELLG